MTFLLYRHTFFDFCLYLVAKYGQSLLVSFKTSSRVQYTYLQPVKHKFQLEYTKCALYTTVMLAQICY